MPQHNSWTVQVRDETLRLLPEKAIWWEKHRLLLLSDLHLGKSGHFRKHGIAAPGELNRKTLQKLGGLIDQLQPQKVIVLGDLFHSRANRDWFEFEEWRKCYPVPFILVRGNHDLLHHSFYKKASLTVTDQLLMAPFRMVHEADEETPGDEMTLSGHIHPSVHLSGKGRQTLRFPCFLISERQLLLPAFGEFTGTYAIRPDESDRIFAVVEEEVIPIQQ
jgi:uncharacterized protein